MTPLEGSHFAKLFADFTWTAERLETLPQYLVPEETDAFAAFKAGERGMPIPNGWVPVLEAAAQRGATVTRVRLLSQPAHLTDYERFELESYRANLDAGERIYIAERRQSVQDRWIFDGRTVVLMNYAENGEYLGAELGDQRDLTYSKRLVQTYLNQAVPLRDYLTVSGVA